MKDSYANTRKRRKDESLITRKLEKERRQQKVNDEQRKRERGES